MPSPSPNQNKNSRQQILQRLSRRQLADVPISSYPMPSAIEFSDLTTAFCQSLQMVGGSAVFADTSRSSTTDVWPIDAINRCLAEVPAFAKAERICSMIEGIERANIDLEQVADPHELADVDFAVATGHFGVAENGAIWVTDNSESKRVALFLSQHLAIVLSASELVHNMHQAYARLELPRPGFGVFISGPSKTADIEQSLVIGAHGARSLTVVLI